MTNKLNGGRGKNNIDLREVAALARSGFRANGYLNHTRVYDELLSRFGSTVFQKTKLVQMIAAILEEVYCPPEYLRVILSRWFENPALIKAGYRDLAD